MYFRVLRERLRYAYALMCLRVSCSACAWDCAGVRGHSRANSLIFPALLIDSYCKNLNRGGGVEGEQLKGRGWRGGEERQG